jgi:hypothetical protein
MAFRVEMLQGETRRGFISREDDENPNSNVAVREFDSIDEAESAIWEMIEPGVLDGDDVRTFHFLVLDDEGIERATVWNDNVEWVWDRS